jgi:hypothetical protein
MQRQSEIVHGRSASRPGASESCMAFSRARSATLPRRIAYLALSLPSARRRNLSFFPQKHGCCKPVHRLGSTRDESRKSADIETKGIWPSASIAPGLARCCQADASNWPNLHARHTIGRQWQQYSNRGRHVCWHGHYRGDGDVSKWTGDGFHPRDSKSRYCRWSRSRRAGSQWRDSELFPGPRVRWQ